MAGHMIVKYLREKSYSIDTVARSNAKFNLDIQNVNITDQFLFEIKDDYDYIINCAGVLVKDSINQPDKAILINSWFPHAIEQTIQKSKTRLIHISTDCVFDGSKGDYIESDPHTESNWYGKSKSMGEVCNTKDLTLRTSIIGPEISDHRTGLLDWVLHRSPMQLQGWHDAWWNGVTTLQLAKCIEHIIVSQPSLAGLYHLAADPINKYDLVRSIVEIYGLTKSVESTNAPKYINKVLVDTRKELKLNIPSHRDMLQQLLEFNK